MSQSNDVTRPDLGTEEGTRSRIPRRVWASAPIPNRTPSSLRKTRTPPAAPEQHRTRPRTAPRPGSLFRVRPHRTAHPQIGISTIRTGWLTSSRLTTRRRTNGDGLTPPQAHDSGHQPTQRPPPDHAGAIGGIVDRRCGSCRLDVGRRDPLRTGSIPGAVRTVDCVGTAHLHRILGRLQQTQGGQHRLQLRRIGRSVPHGGAVAGLSRVHADGTDLPHLVRRLGDDQRSVGGQEDPVDPPDRDIMDQPGDGDIGGARRQDIRTRRLNERRIGRDVIAAQFGEEPVVFRVRVVDRCGVPGAGGHQQGAGRSAGMCRHRGQQHADTHHCENGTQTCRADHRCGRHRQASSGADRAPLSPLRHRRTTSGSDVFCGTGRIPGSTDHCTDWAMATACSRSGTPSSRSVTPDRCQISDGPDCRAVCVSSTPDGSTTTIG